jgi:hypothetical protein
MKESELNLIIKNTFNENEFCFKIPDGREGIAIQNPFDLFGVIQGRPSYIESKLIKGGIYSFNFDKIEDHQFANLLKIENCIKVPHHCLIAVGFYKPRELKIVMFFDFMYIWNEKQNGRKSFLKKELEVYYNNNMFLPIKSTLTNGKKSDRIIGIENLEGKIIYGKTS